MTSPSANLDPLALAGAYLLHPRVAPDSRGAFRVLSSRRELAAEGVTFSPDIHAVAENRAAGTLRGLHFQRHPYNEAKIVRCLSGAVFDVIVDLRQGSPTYMRWSAVDLRPGGPAVIVPRGFAHGYVTTEPDTAIEYLLEGPYAPDAADGIAWNDPALGIDWPIAAPAEISSRDATLPTLASRPVTLPPAD